MNPTTKEIVEELRFEASMYVGSHTSAVCGIAADRLEGLEAAMTRLGQFGKLFMDYTGDPRGPMGRMGGASLIEEAFRMEPIIDVDSNKWIPVQEDVLKELSRLKAQMRWIPVTERLPWEGVTVLTLDKRGHMRDRALYTFMDGKRLFRPDGLAPGYDVIYWMPLPEKPKKVE